MAWKLFPGPTEVSKNPLQNGIWEGLCADLDKFR